ncbi:MAG: 3-dehydroquinate synthase [Acidobacteria bacterium]|nr:3-dehydroquinate synthase [Acidobacteriota bacterium]
MLVDSLAEIEVSLSGRDYLIQVKSGLLELLGEKVKAVASPYSRKVVIISNKKVFSLYGAKVIGSLNNYFEKTYSFLINDGEKYKTLSTAEKIYGFLIENKIERHDIIIALGGGVIGDLAGFAAATYLRGISYVQVPTSLLAQIDAAIGGKTAVNHPKGKNLIGAFHQPKLVAIDPIVLETLPKRELKSAMYEVIKYGVIADKDLFYLLKKERTKILSRDKDLLSEIIFRCCNIKAGVVSRDEHEKGERRILNFGHTIGHALETVTNYRRFKHGEAVGYGMIAASNIARELGFLTEAERLEIENLIISYGLLPQIKNVNLELVLQAMQQDKKSLAGQLIFVLPEQIGRVIIGETVPVALIYQVLEKLLIN